MSRLPRQLLTALCLGVATLPLQAASGDDLARLTAETRATTQPLLARVVETVKQGLANSTPHETVDLCRENLPGMVKEMRDQTGWNIRRVSLKTRNAERGTPEEWERLVLADFDRRAAAGEKRETIEVGEVFAQPEGRVLRYMRALPVQQACLECHGDSARLSPQLKARLAALYPADQATGYQLGQIRGALTVKRTLP